MRQRLPGDRPVFALGNLYSFLKTMKIGGENGARPIFFDLSRNIFVFLKSYCI